MKLISDSIVTISSKSAETILNVLSIIVLSRLLTPKDFGLFSLVLASYSILNALMDMGLTPTYVRAKNPTEELKNSFFTINIFIGFFGSIIMVGLAPILGYIYKEEIFFSLMLVYSLSIVLLAFSRQGVAELTRDKKFKELMKVNLYATSISIVLSIISAYADFGVWVFNVRAVTHSIIFALLISIMNKKRYRIASFKMIISFFEELKFVSLLLYGRVLNGIFSSFDKFFLGFFIGVDDLGHFKRSQQISLMTDHQIRMPLGEVVFSYLERSRVSEKKTLYNFYAIALLILTFGINGMLFLEGDKIILLILGEQWILASQLIQFLSIFSTGLILRGILRTIFMSEDRLKELNNFNLLSIFILFFVIGITHFFKYNIETFTFIFSIGILFYWFIILTYYLKTISGNLLFIRYFLGLSAGLVLINDIERLTSFSLESTFLSSMLFLFLLIIAFAYVFSRTLIRNKALLN